MNKLSKILFLLLLTVSCTVQKSENSMNSKASVINKNNYYNYELKASGIETDWLRYEEAKSIITDEISKLGYTQKDFYTGISMSLKGNLSITVDYYFPNRKFGIIYGTGHSGVISVEQRNKNNRFSQIGVDASGKIYSSGLSFIPNNIFVLQETWYWFQSSFDGKSNPQVTKKIAENILREDVDVLLGKKK